MLHGRTPLHEAVRASSIDEDEGDLWRLRLIRHLLSHGANVNAIDGDGYTPLFEAVSAFCSQDVIKLLITHGANTHYRNSDGQTVLHVALVFGYADLETVRKDVTYAYEIFERRRDWPLLDMTAKPIEEAAAEIIAIIRRKPAKV